jgi:hypothetical protein
MRASRLLHGTATAQRFTPPISSLRSPDQLHLQGHGTTELYRLGLLIPSWVFRMLTACLQGTMGPECFDCQCEVHPRKAHPQDPRKAHPQVSASPLCAAAGLRDHQFPRVMRREAARQDPVFFNAILCTRKVLHWFALTRAFCSP